MRIIQKLKKKFFVRDATRLFDVVVMLLAFETFNSDSVFTLIKNFYFYINVIKFVCIQLWDLLCGNFYKVSKTRPKVLD